MADPEPPLDEATDAFARAALALALLAVDPGLGGIAVRARSGPVRDALTAMLPHLPLPMRRLHPGVDDVALFGGLDVAATLATGRSVASAGLLATPAALVLTMAERAGQGLAARLALALDEGAGHCLIALDEGEDDTLSPALAERLAFRADLDGIAMGDVTGFGWDADDLTNARAVLASVTVPDTIAPRVVRVCADFGIASQRAPLFALRVARAHAALEGRDNVDDADLRAACELVLAHRATQVPEDVPPDADDTPPPDTDDEAESPDETPPDPEDTLDLPDELLIAAVRALIPDDLLARIASGTVRGTGSGSGAKKTGNRRGRPLPSRAGRPDGSARIDIVATLRSAAPWQTIRRTATGRDGLQIRGSDIRLRRFEDRSDRLLIFAVDASGSAAIARLAEAKGAVELLLAQAYARRDHVALIAFRGSGAEVLLPPTRSLVQTKRRLAGLPGGGGTPLAAGLQSAAELAGHARRRGLSPVLAILTDGRANVALDGTANRAQAAADAQRVGRTIRAAAIPGIVIDTGNRPEPALRDLARTLDARYLALPRANAERLSDAVTAALS